MRILYLSPRQCWPAISGAKLRDFYLARALGEQFDLSYAYFVQDHALTSGELPFCRQLVGVPKPKTYTPLKLVRGVLTRQPLSVINYNSAGMQRALASLLEGAPFDIIHVDGVHMASYVPLFARHSSSRIVFSWHNIESELMFRYASSSTSLPRRMYASLTGRRLARVEQEMLEGAFGHVVCSERERDELLRRAPSARVAVIENGVDTGRFSPRSEAGVRNRIVLVGLMNYLPNVEASIWFAREIWPALYARFPQWKLTLVGADPLPAVQALANLPGVEVTGTVEDVRPYYEQAVIAIVPLKTGAGTRLKILEAMAAGVPVVSTPLGAEGLKVTPGKDILIAGPEPEWMEACSRLAGEPALAADLVRSARELVTAQYDWRVMGGRLVSTYQEWCG